ncbi:DUF4479 and tRNA-binding domain-containing protein [Apilactobacillus apisilvae]|uniref:DUF4479 and tRNA-binding domain-containing protein n=1 Tax=Apilactobacillus apisilvae TaxID=2923364 RepID=A0ABY4PHM4_9LACO|nr:DUF4479 domain-containing protein [Apilactobacillus apisilvae]UQS85259.1 DUF4479 and tRNA-binding domain-containing protein [Apilactobacillus apisilvae]
MLIASYNPKQNGDILVVVLGETTGEQNVEYKNDIVTISETDNGEIIGYNFLNASHILPKLTDMNGQIDLNADDVTKLNDALKAQNLADNIVLDDDPKFVVGYVKSVSDHPKSDHLKITETEVNDGKSLQIVSGSPNMQANIKVVVAKVGAMMPDGLIIFPGELKGEDSNGMICSGRELHIPNAPQKPGALILPDNYEVGSEFDFDNASTLFE